MKNIGETERRVELDIGERDLMSVTVRGSFLEWNREGNICRLGSLISSRDCDFYPKTKDRQVKIAARGSRALLLESFLAICYIVWRVHTSPVL